MPSEEKKTTPPRRRWFQFRLRTLLVLALLASGVFRWIGWELDQRRREKKTIEWAEGLSGSVYFSGDDFNGYGDISWWLKTKDGWFGQRVASIVLRDDLDDLSPLTELKSLEALSCYGKNVSDLSPLAELKSLESFVCRSRNVSDPTPLAELKNLKKLSLSNAQVSDLSPLAGLKNLESLSLYATPAVSDLSPLAGLTNLESLGFGRTGVSDLTLWQV